KTRAPRPGRSREPSGSRMSAPNALASSASTGDPGRCTSRTRESASITTAPCSARRRAMVDFPEAMPPVSAIKGMQRGCHGGGRRSGVDAVGYHDRRLQWGGATVDERRSAVVIEDDADIRSLLSTVLEQGGFAVRAADNGYAGLDLVRAHDPL